MRDTLDKLRATRDAIVTDYDSVENIDERAADRLAPFPFGAGFLDGAPGPRRVMVVCHNAYPGRNHPEEAFYLSLFAYLDAAGLRRDEVFLTNVLMGTRPDSANGNMAEYCTPLFVEQCLTFFAEQVRLIDPEAIVVCGEETKALLRKARWLNDPRVVCVPHPSSCRSPKQRSERAPKVGVLIRALL
jgi:hypothetical protein